MILFQKRFHAGIVVNAPNYGYGALSAAVAQAEADLSAPSEN